MSAVICFPKTALPLVAIYVAGEDSDTLLDTVPATNMEYEDPTGSYSTNYKIAFTDGATESTKITVQSVAQQILDIIRIELKINNTTIPSSEIDFLIGQAKLDIQTDLCIFVYGAQLTRLEGAIYKLPNKFFYDLNCAGVVSILDVEVWKQSLPLHIYSPKTPVAAKYIDTAWKGQYIELAVVPAATDIIKMNFYCTTMNITSDILRKLLAYRICAMYYQNKSIESSASSMGASGISGVKIGDISVSYGAASSKATNIDAYAKMNAKYQTLVDKYKSRLKRVN